MIPYIVTNKQFLPCGNFITDFALSQILHKNDRQFLGGIINIKAGRKGFIIYNQGQSIIRFMDSTLSEDSKGQGLD